jgi:2-amino-4-hydroxy-6-hydroxymethyldihydropteridine diphosphokinase
MKNKLVLGLGSNLGNRYAYIHQAKQLIELVLGAKGKLSNVYTSPPWGETNQPGFLNAALILETEKNIEFCFAAIKNTEKELGRIHIKRWGPRCIDIDILFFNDNILETDNLCVPHKNIAERAFVLAPLADIVPDFEHPITKKTMVELLQNLDNNCSLFI